MIDGAYLYIVVCADGSYYVGTTRKDLEERIGEHNAGRRSRKAPTSPHPPPIPDRPPSSFETPARDCLLVMSRRSMARAGSSG